LKDGAVLIRLNTPEEKQTVMRRLVEEYEVDGVRVFEPSLNDIFVEYASEEGEGK
jgi:ABC-2 type transport system ATP-binding protein